MSRAVLAVLALGAAACVDWSGELDRCQAEGRCASDDGGAGGGSTTGGGGGAAGGGGGVTGGGGGTAGGGGDDGGTGGGGVATGGGGGSNDGGSNDGGSNDGGSNDGGTGGGGGAPGDCCVNPAFCYPPQQLAGPLAAPEGLRVASGVAYVALNNANAVREIPLDGGTAVTHPLPGSPHYVDYESPFIYATAITGDAGVYRLQSGSPLTQLAAAPSSGEVTHDADFIYWISGSAPTGTVRRVAKDGSSAQIVASGQANPYGIALDGRGVYWTTSTAVMAAPLDGGLPYVVAPLLGQGSAIAVDSNILYVGTSNGQAGQVFFDGGVGLVWDAGGVSDIACDGRYAYWADPSAAGHIVAAPLDGGPPRCLALTNSASKLFVTGGWVYFTTRTSTGVLARVPVPP